MNIDIDWPWIDEISRSARKEAKESLMSSRYNIVGVVSAVSRVRGRELVRGDKLSIYRARV